jgi:P-type conjugative transfer protein TrbJ
MIALSRRRVLSGALGCGLLAGALTEGPPAHADLFGGDLPILAGILVQTIEQAMTMANVLTQTISQVKMMTTMLETLNAGSFASLVNFINTARYSYNSLTYGVRSMTYTMARIDGEYKQLFPGDEPAPGATVAQHRAQYRAWNQEVVGASQVAARQQTTLAQLDQHAAQTQNILNQSQSASGVVSQLQLIAQLLGITNAQLIVMNQTLATSSRVLSDMAAAGASERMTSSVSKDDSLAGYTDKGPPVVVPHTLP